MRFTMLVTETHELQIHLSEFLEVIFEQFPDLKWIVGEIEAVAKGPIPWGERMLDFENRVASSSSGVWLTEAELSSLASALLDVINILLIGVANESRGFQFSRSSQMYNLGDVVIEHFDSTTWTVDTSSPDLVEALQARFPDLEIMSASALANWVRLWQ